MAHRDIEEDGYMKNKGEIVSSLMLLFGITAVLVFWLGIASFEIIYTSFFHEIKNDIYMINRNVLLSLTRYSMGEDRSDFYSNAEEMIEKEIKKLWNVDVSGISETGYVRSAKIEKVNLTVSENELIIDTTLKLTLNSFVFKNSVKDSLTFCVREKTKIRKALG